VVYEKNTKYHKYFCIIKKLSIITTTMPWLWTTY
jgi:hypothetical protein